MQPITILGVLLCFGVLFLRYRSQAQAPARTRRTRSQKLKTAKILWAALLAWLAVGFALQRLNANLDGTAPEPSLMERMVAFLSH